MNIILKIYGEKMNYKVLTHSAISINNDIYIDPFNLESNLPKAKFVFITHPHFDHLSEKDISKITDGSTKFICPKDCTEKLINMKIDLKNIFEVEPNKAYEVDNLKFQTIASYNVNKKFHLKESGWVGYIIEVENCKLCILGDTDINSDNKTIQCDILFIPIGGTYTMNIDEAIELTKIINPKIAIPTHYGSIVGEKNLGEKFKAQLENTGIKVEIFIK